MGVLTSKEARYFKPLPRKSCEWKKLIVPSFADVCHRLQLGIIGLWFAGLSGLSTLNGSTSIDFFGINSFRFSIGLTSATELIKFVDDATLVGMAVSMYRQVLLSKPVRERQIRGHMEQGGASDISTVHCNSDAVLLHSLRQLQCWM